MTGEVTIRGQVLAIGGLKEKMLAAKRAGMTKVLVPKANEKDVREFDTEITENIEIVYVKKIEDVVREALLSEQTPGPAEDRSYSRHQRKRFHPGVSCVCI